MWNGVRKLKPMRECAFGDLIVVVQCAPTTNPAFVVGITKQVSRFYVGVVWSSLEDPAGQSNRNLPFLQSQYGEGVVKPHRSRSIVSNSWRNHLCQGRKSPVKWICHLSVAFERLASLPPWEPDQDAYRRGLLRDRKLTRVTKGKWNYIPSYTDPELLYGGAPFAPPPSDSLPVKGSAGVLARHWCRSVPSPL
jgi:hypothetical protein